MMTPFRLAVIFLILAFAWFLTGCSNKSAGDVPIPDATATLDGVRFTEATVMGEVADVRLALRDAVDASKGLQSEPAVRAAAAEVEASLKTVEETLAAHPAADVEKLVDDFMRAIEQLREVIKQRDAEILRLKDAATIYWQRILIGIGIVCTLGGVASGFFAASIPVAGPYLGPRIGIMLGVAAGVCFALARLMKWAQDNPGWATGIAVAFICIAAGLAWANKVEHADAERLKS